MPVFIHKHHGFALGQFAATTRHIANAKFWSWQINENGYRLTGVLPCLADLPNALCMLDMIPM
jgi:hypothetical protein